MKKAYGITGTIAFAALLCVCGAFDAYMIGFADFFVLGGGLVFGVISSMYGWFVTDADERQKELNEKRKKAGEGGRNA